jgi:hypothetical protein
VALDYTNPIKNQYAFKLDNFHDEWIYVGNRRFASFTNLSPGEYTFRVKGSNSDGIWNEQQQEATGKNNNYSLLSGARTGFISLPWLRWWICAKLFYDYRVKRKVYR